MDVGTKTKAREGVGLCLLDDRLEAVVATRTAALLNSSDVRLIYLTMALNA
jgi:hypothetical protein